MLTSQAYRKLHREKEIQDCLVHLRFGVARLRILGLRYRSYTRTYSLEDKERGLWLLIHRRTVDLVLFRGDTCCSHLRRLGYEESW